MMKISPSGAISKLGIRLRERRNRSNGGGYALTETDDSNISKFEDLLSNAIFVLEQENDALSKGDVDKVASFFETKSSILKTLELKQPVIEPFLREDIPEISSLRELIKNLSEQLKRNGQLLEGMADASRSIISEVERFRERQGLKGLYDKKGRLRDNVGPYEKNFDKDL